MVRERSVRLGWGDQADADHGVSGDALGAAADVEVDIRRVALQEKPFAPHVEPLVVTAEHDNGKSAEGAEITIVAQVVADARTAYLQYISITKKLGGLYRLGQRCTERGALIQVDVAAISPLHQHLHRHGNAVGENIHTLELKASSYHSRMGQAL